MRSRYAAYVVGDTDYLLATWHPSTKPAALNLDKAQRWLGLQIKQHKIQDDTHATVEFVARSRQGGGSAQRLHETSRFVKENGTWFYVEGDLH